MGERYYLIMPFGSKGQAAPGRGERENGEGEEEESLRSCGASWSIGKPGADFEIVSTVTPPPTPPSLILSSL